MGSSHRCRVRSFLCLETENNAGDFSYSNASADGILARISLSPFWILHVCRRDSIRADGVCVETVANHFSHDNDVGARLSRQSLETICDSFICRNIVFRAPHGHFYHGNVVLELPPTQSQGAECRRERFCRGRRSRKIFGEPAQRRTSSCFEPPNDQRGGHSGVWISTLSTNG